jgi:ribosomal protein L29
MEMKELQQKNDTDLQKFITEKREELRNIRFGTAGSGMRDASATAKTKKVIARALTELNSRNRASKA